MFFALRRALHSLDLWDDKQLIEHFGLSESGDIDFDDVEPTGARSDAAAVHTCPFRGRRSWRYDSARGWVMQGEYMHSLRVAENDEFPFALLADLVNHAREG